MKYLKDGFIVQYTGKDARGFCFGILPEVALIK